MRLLDGRRVKVIRHARSREHQDVEQLGAGCRTEGVQALTEFALDVLQVHEGRTLPPGVSRLPREG
jgi:hypothetical protein